jgi:hypothetical protein
MPAKRQNKESELSPLSQFDRERADNVLLSSGLWNDVPISDRIRRTVLEGLKRDEERGKKI